MLTKDTVLKVAQLARLTITDEEAQAYQVQFEKILTYFENISALDTKGIEPLVTPIHTPAFLREDIVIQDVTAEDILKNAPDSKGHLFKVPPVI